MDRFLYTLYRTLGLACSNTKERSIRAFLFDPTTYVCPCPLTTEILGSRWTPACQLDAPFARKALRQDAARRSSFGR